MYLLEGFDSYRMLDLKSPTLTSQLNFENVFKHTQASIDFLFNLFILSSALSFHTYSVFP